MGWWPAIYPAAGPRRIHALRSRDQVAVIEREIDDGRPGFPDMMAERVITFVIWLRVGQQTGGIAAGAVGCLVFAWMAPCLVQGLVKLT
jgi:hypothetical protein